MRYQQHPLIILQVHVDGIGDVMALVDIQAEWAAIHRRHASEAFMKPWTQPRLRGFGGSVLQVGALDLTIWTGAGRRSSMAVPVYADLPKDAILGADHLLSSDVEVRIERGDAHLPPSTVGQPSPTIDEGQSTFPDDLTLLLEHQKALFADNTAQLPGTNLLAHSITMGDHPPVCVPLRRYAEKERQWLASRPWRCPMQA